MYRGEPSFSPEAHRLDLGKTNLVALVVGFVLTGLLTWGCVSVVLDPAQGAARWVGLGFGVFFGALAVLFVVGFRRAVRPRGFVIDVTGIWFWDGPAWDCVPWEAVGRAGISFEQPPGVPSITVEDAVKDWAADKAMGALRMTNRRRTALEVTPADAAWADRFPRLAKYRKPDPQPVPGLPPVRWYVPVVAGYRSWDQLIAAGARCGGDRWAGFFQRPWGSIGTGWVQPRG